MSNQGDKPIARVLVGMLVSTAQVEALQELQRELDGNVDAADLADNQKAAARRNELLSDFRMQLSRGIPNERSRKTLASLRDQVASGAVEVKVFTRKPLHGKTYIFHRDTNLQPPFSKPRCLSFHLLNILIRKEFRVYKKAWCKNFIYIKYK
jgi:hypothetical protein